jgi:hypothetical protein
MEEEPSEAGAVHESIARPGGRRIADIADIAYSRCTIWLFNIAIENPSSMEVSSWENHLFQWAIFHGELLNNQRVIQK